MKKLKHIFKLTNFILFSFFVLINVCAQDQIVVTGKVTDETGEGIPFATVASLDKNNRIIGGKVTDMNGNYSIRINSDGVIQFSFVGYESRIEQVNNRKIINVGLDLKTTGIDEVQIIGVAGKGPVTTGYTVIEQKDIAESISSIQVDKIASKTPITSLGQMLQGQIAGVQIITNSGDPGAGVTVKIRGNSSLSGNSGPLYIVDGIPYLSRSTDEASSISKKERSPISDINPNDIEKIDVLKDASATAIYGARAGNGVVIITTKRGKKGEAKVNLSSKVSYNQAAEPIPLLDGNSYRILQLLGYQNAGKRNEAVDRLRGDPYAAWNENYNNNTDWVDELSINSISHDHNINIRGGGEKTTYSFSLGYLNEKGTIIGSDHNRISGRFNLDYDVSDKLRFGNSIYYSYSKSNLPRVGNPEEEEEGIDPYRMAFIKAPNLSVYQQDSLGRNTSTYFSPDPQEIFIQGDDVLNPVHLANSLSSKSVDNNFTLGIFGIFTPFKDLSITSRFSLNSYANTTFGFIPGSATGLIWSNDLVNRNFSASSSETDITQENIFSYKRTFGEKHELFSTFVTSLEIGFHDEFNNSSSNTGSELIQHIDGSNRWSELESPKGSNALISQTAQVRYIFNSKYSIVGTMRRDGSSKFGEDNRYGYFPAVAGYWRVSDEFFMENISLINDLKLRISYGANGSPPEDDFLYLGRYTSEGRYLDYSVVAPENIQLDHLKWETSIQRNIGFDFAMWNNRLYIVNDWYIKTTYDLIYERRIPTSTGREDVTQNFGDIENKGFDLGIELYILQGTYNWNINFNLTRNINFVRRLPSTEPIIEYVADDNYLVKVDIGDAIGSIYGYQTRGIYERDEDVIARDEWGNQIFDFGGVPKPLIHGGHEFRGGDVEYVDQNFDGLINEFDIVKIGDSNPDFFGGITSEFSYNNFTLNLFFEYKYGHDIVNLTRLNTENTSDDSNSNNATIRSWRRQGDDTDIPRVIFGNDVNFLGSDRFIEDGSYIRLRTATLSYSWPKRIYEKLKLDNLEMYLAAFNLYTWTKYTGADPEIGLESRNPLSVAIDDAKTYLPHIYTFGINISF